jgi:hypothetical protein
MNEYYNTQILHFRVRLAYISKSLHNHLVHNNVVYQLLARLVTPFSGKNVKLLSVELPFCGLKKWTRFCHFFPDEYIPSAQRISPPTSKLVA